MKFTSPLFLLLLLLVPIIVWMGAPSSGSARRREIVSLILRLIIVLSLIFALAGLEIVRNTNNLAVVFLMDVSDSMPQEAINSEVDYVRSALQAMGPDDQSAIVLFGADALVERPMSPVKELSAITSAPITNQTNLAQAIQLGLALFPSGYAKRMIVLSDGAQTVGDALETAKFAIASDVQIVTVPFVSKTGAEAWITNVDVPAHLRPHEQFELNVSIQASESMRAVVRVLAGDKILYEQTYNLHKGSQTFSLPLTSDQPGFVNYQVQIAPEKDVFYQNNRMDAFSQVEGPPKILVVAPTPGDAFPGGGTRPDESSALIESLKAADFDVSLVTPSLLPSDLPTLAQYNSVVLVDVPARMLGNNQMENLRSYVHDLGGGLVAVGGPTSFGVGGYFHTPLEEALPVDMQIKDEKRRPTLGIVFIIDHSGSMSETSGGVQKVELAKEAAARSIELLFPTDRVGVIQFDDTASWVVPMTTLDDPGRVINAIGTIRAGGGTDIMAGVQAMAKVLPGDPAKVKHVILLTDGGADPTGISELVEKLYQENGITFSTVGVGNDAAPFLDDLALVGGGRYHFTNDASSIPSIFTEETSLATRAYIVEESFFPTLVNTSPILTGIDETPHLYGYVATSPKDLAQVILESQKHDPILAAWQYGLGKSVAFTSDASGHWAKDWLTWNRFAAFWIQAVRYTIGSSIKTSLAMNVDSNGHITLDAREPNGNFLNGYQVNANIVAPNGESQSVTLKQTAPGRYEAAFNPTDQGVYLIRFSGKSQDRQSSDSFAQTTGWTLSYSPEYKRIESDPDLLVRLAAISGGKVASSNPADAFTHDLKSTRASRPIWQWLILIAALLLPFDIASRRLIITRQDMIRLRWWLIQKLDFRKSSAAPQPQRAARLDALFQAKDRVRENPLTALEADQLKIESPTTDEPVIKEKPASETPAKGTSTTRALLAHKKNLRKRDE